MKKQCHVGKDAALRHRSASPPRDGQRASLTAAHWGVRRPSNSRGCCYHLPPSELVSSQRQGNPRSSAHFKGQAGKNNPGAHAPGPTAPSFRLLEPCVAQLQMTSLVKQLKETLSPAMFEQYNSAGVATLLSCVV